MKVALTGASGFIGKHLQKIYTNNVTIGRDDTQQMILEKLDGVDVVINLAGAPILKRWSDSYKKVLYSSRIKTTQKLVSAINQSDAKLFISTSAIGAYPDDNIFNESFEEYGDDFLGNLTKEWEAEAFKCKLPTAVLRFGVILGFNGGALTQMLPPFKMGLGGVIGDGKMVMSWIDIEDLLGIYEHIIENKLTGLYNATSPNPVSNYIFTKALGNTLRRPTVFPLPEFVLKILFGEGSTVLTASKEIIPQAILDAGYEFKYPTIESSLKHLLD